MLGCAGGAPAARPPVRPSLVWHDLGGMADKRPRKYLRPSAYQNKHGSWTWGGGIVGALAPVVIKFLLHGDFHELGVGWGIAALVGCAVGLFVGSQLFESAHYTVDD